MPTGFFGQLTLNVLLIMSFTAKLSFVPDDETLALATPSTALTVALHQEKIGEAHATCGDAEKQYI